AGGVRRLVETEVLDRWTTRKPAYKVALVGGTELVASAEHLFLTEHGWRRVASCDHEDVPALSPGDVLVGWGAYGEAATHDDVYALGYLSGVVRGDGLLGHQGHERPAGQGGGRYRFELVLEDERALGRAQGYLERFGVRPKR